MKAVILAAGQGTRLRPITDTVPKCMVPVGGVPLIDRLIARLEEVAIDELIVVSGYLHDVLETYLRSSESRLGSKARVIFNERYEDWGNFYSLLVAESAVDGDSFIKLDGDVVLDETVLPTLLAAPGPGVLMVDPRDSLGAEEMKVRLGKGGRIVELNKRMDPALAFGESIGVERIDADLAPAVFDQLRELITRKETHEYYERAYELLMIAGTSFGYADIGGCVWTEIDDAADLERAEAIVA